jgi:hypothetical protein
MNQYKLTFTVTFEELDDPAARKHAKELAETIAKIEPGADVKLQQVYQGQPPRGVRLS